MGIKWAWNWHYPHLRYFWCTKELFSILWLSFQKIQFKTQLPTVFFLLFLIPEKKTFKWPATYCILTTIKSFKADISSTDPFSFALTKGQRSKHQFWNSLQCPIYIITSFDKTKITLLLPTTQHHSFTRNTYCTPWLN